MKNLFWGVAAVAAMLFVACDSDSGTSANGNEESTASHSEVILSSSQNQQSSSSNNVDPESTQGDESSSSVKRSSSSQSEIDSESTSSSSVDSLGGKYSSNSNEDFDTCEEDEEGYTTRIDDVKYKCIDGYWIEQSSSSAASSSSYFDMTKQFSDKYSYGEFTDPRDGQVYKTITYEYGHIYWGIDSITVFAQNLNYGRMVSGGSVQSDSTKYCYNDDPWYCDNGFGGLYSWSNAMNFPSDCDSAGTGSAKCPNTFDLTHKNGLTTHDDDFPEKIDYVEHQGICPKGWHVMNYGEWVVVIMQKVDDNNYIHRYFGSEISSFGDNTYGFSLLPAGWWSVANSKFDWIGRKTFVWLQAESAEDSTLASYADIETSTSFFSVAYYNYKRSAISVRCTKDY